MLVHFETMKEEPGYGYTDRTGAARILPRFSIEIQLTLNGERRRVSCSEITCGYLVVHGIALMFSQGAKVWEGTAIYWPKTGRVSNMTPRIDRRGHFRAVGFFEDYRAKPVASQHNGA